MIHYFSKKNAANGALLFVYAILLKFSFFSAPQIALQSKADGLLYKLLIKQLAVAGSYANVWSSYLAFLLLLLQALLFSNLIVKTKLFNKPNYLAGMSYLLVTSLFYQWNVLSAALVVNTLLLFVWQLTVALQHTAKPQTILFNLGLLICCANFFYSFSFAFLLLVIIGLLTYRAFRANEYLILLMGYLVPFYCLFCYQYLTDSLSISTYKLPISIRIPQVQNAQWFWGSAIAILAITIVGVFFIQRQSGKMNIQSRKNWSIIFFWLLISFGIPFFGSDVRFWILSMLPIAAFIAAVFYYITNKKVQTVLHWSLFGLAIIIQYFIHSF